MGHACVKVLGGTVLGILGCSVTSAPAGTLRHDVDGQVYVDYADAIKGVGGVSVAIDGLLPTGFGSGVLVAPQWVLTSAHVIDGVNQYTRISFETDPDPTEVPDNSIPGLPIYLSGLYEVEAVEIHPNWSSSASTNGGFDLALLRLDRPVTYLNPYPLFRGNPASNPELDRQGTSVGFGATGTGITGFEAGSGGLLRLAGDNMIDGLGGDPRMVDQFVSRTITVNGQPVILSPTDIGNQFLLSDFDGPPSDSQWTNPGLNPLGAATPLPLEYSVGPGDSGGPLLTLVNGQWHVMGINAFIYGLPAPDGDGTDNATYNDLQGYQRISPFTDWIDSVTGIPEPASLAWLALATLALARRRTR